jgi:hypothetical protein
MPRFKAAKDRIKLLLTTNAAGDCKLKVLLTYHAENPHAFTGLSKCIHPVYVHSNQKAWKTRELFDNWFMNSYIPGVEKFCTGNNIIFKLSLSSIIMLVIRHIQTTHKSVFLPPNKRQSSSLWIRQ